MVESVGQFAGKTAFSSQPDAGNVVYLTTFTADSAGSEPLLLPAMLAPAVTDQERCILYAQPDGSLRIQLGNLLWIALEETLGWLILNDDPSEAAAFVLQGNPPGQQWQVRTSNGLATVWYTLDKQSPILTINKAPKTFDQFAPLVVTPSLDQMRQAKSCRKGDLTNVDLHGQSLSGIDFTGANFYHATLTDVTFTDAVLDSASFSHTDLTGLAWGSPTRAHEVVLTGCLAQGAVLGGQTTPLDCTGANLASGHFQDADLRGLILTGAQANGAILVGSHLDGAVLDKANLQDAVLQGASLQSFHGRNASLQEIKAQGASFVGAKLSGADLTRAQLDAKAYLFTLSGPSVQQLTTELDHYPFAQPDLVQAFTDQGITISPEDPVTVQTKGQSWQIQDPNGPYVLLVNTAEDLDVFLARPDLRPAVLRGAICQGTTAPGAMLTGADLRGVQWYGSGATLDHADLRGAVLAGSLLEGTDFTQAHLDGADLSQCVLVQARFRGCLVGPGESRQAFSLEGSLLHGADFTDATLLSALLVDAAVALPHGVPLFSLPAGSQQDLNTQGLASLSNLFGQAGYPLGSAPTITQIQIWLLDNHNDPDHSMPQLYRVQMTQGQLNVSDGESGTSLFALPADRSKLLASPTPPAELVADFSQNGYSLDPEAPITSQGYWEIRLSADAPRARPASYPRLRVYADTSGLPVYGSVLVTPRDWPQYSFAFGATQALDAALNPASLGPSGYPRAWVDQGLLDWEALMTVGAPPTPTGRSGPAMWNARPGARTLRSAGR